MDKKSQALIVIFALMVTASAVTTFYRYVVIEKITFYTDEEAFNLALLEE